MKEKLFKIAESYYNSLRDSGEFIGNLEHGAFEMKLPIQTMHTAVVSVAYGDIKEIRLIYSNGIYETIRLKSFNLYRED